MDLEYIKMVEDALLHLRKEKLQNSDNDAFFLTMKCYERARSSF
jgi:hypothetical protein